MGLISFYRTQDKSLIPSVNKNEIVEVPMEEYQFINYSKVRKAEIEQDKRKKSKSKSKDKKKTQTKDGDGEIFEQKSSYRAYSRMHCSFVFQETIPRPYPQEGLEEKLEELIEKEIDTTEFTDILETKVTSEQKAKMKTKTKHK